MTTYKSMSVERPIFQADESKTKRQYSAYDLEHPYRNAYQRDRDRILYSKEFRRLSGKTQMFYAGYRDNSRTRLTHSIEVSRIADTIARQLKLNVFLTEAIAFGHDVGHTPFGHVGEQTLNMLMNGCRPDTYFSYNSQIPDAMRGFKHNYQGVRVVTELEKVTSDYIGINLTRNTLWGILHHTKTSYQSCNYYNEYTPDKTKCIYKNSGNACTINGCYSLSFYKKIDDMFCDESDWTFEAYVVAESDEIAQRNHDIEDALSEGIVDVDDLCDVILRVFVNYLHDSDIELIKSIRKENAKELQINKCSHFILDLYIREYINAFKEHMQELTLGKTAIESNNMFYIKKGEIYPATSKYFKDGIKFKNEEHEFQTYLYKTIINSGLTQRMNGLASYYIRSIIKAYLTDPRQLPDETVISVYKNCDSTNGLTGNRLSDAVKARNYMEKMLILRDDNGNALSQSNDFNVALLRTICDHIAGMTDKYAANTYMTLYGNTAFSY